MNRGKVKIIDTQNKRLVNKKLEESLTGSTASFHSLMELSTSEAKFLKNNSITLSGLSFIQNEGKGPLLAQHKNVEYGDNVRQKDKTSVIDGKTSTHTEIELCRMKNKCLAITADKNECKKALPNIVIIETGFRQNKVLKPSNVVLLFLGVICK